MITENYIKMCEQAEEIQKLWRKPFKNYLGDLFWKGKEYLMIPEACSFVIEIMFEPDDNCIWLPTQEQLQEISQEEYSKSLKKSLAWFGYFVKFVKNKYQDDSIAHEYFNEMNELWLAFVMKEKYHKIWTGEKWVKGNE